MKRKDFFKKLDNELNNIAPPLSEELEKMPITIDDSSFVALKSAEDKKSNAFSFSWKKLTACAVALILMFTIVGGVSYGFYNSKSEAIMTVSINPEVSVLLDKNMRVAKVVSENADGDILLSDDEFRNNIIGKNAADSVRMIAEEADKLGYLKDTDGKNKEISITVTNKKGKIGNDKRKLENVLKEYNFEKYDISVKKADDFNNVYSNKENSDFYYKNLKEETDELEKYINEIINDLIEFINSENLGELFDEIANSDFWEEIIEDYEISIDNLCDYIRNIIENPEINLEKLYEYIYNIIENTATNLENLIEEIIKCSLDIRKNLNNK